MDLLQQQRREEQILSLFGSIEDRELHRSDLGEPAGPDQSATPWEPAELRPPDAAPAGPTAARASIISTATVTGVPPAVGATQLPVKRKRGRPPKHATALNGQSNAQMTAASYLRKHVEEEEDVYFICFDGGTLIFKLCNKGG